MLKSFTDHKLIALGVQAMGGNVDVTEKGQTRMTCGAGMPSHHRMNGLE